MSETFEPRDPNDDLCSCMACMAPVPSTMFERVAEMAGLTPQAVARVDELLARERRADGNIADMVRWTAADLGLKVEAVLGAARTAELARARFAIAWGARHAIGRSFPQIARALRRDHSTAISAFRRAEVLRANSAPFRDLTDRMLHVFGDRT
jgi:chromosomal replication initiation ATPase DnaA